MRPPVDFSTDEPILKALVFQHFFGDQLFVLWASSLPRSVLQLVFHSSVGTVWVPWQGQSNHFMDRTDGRIGDG